MAEASVPAGAQEPGVSEHLEAACVEISYAGAHRFKIESWGPFAEGKNDLFRNLVLTGIGAEHAKSVGQVVLRWLTQRGVIVIPKSVRRERMRENMDIFDFQLTDEQMTQIAGLDGGVSLFFDHRDPERVSWLNRRAEQARAARSCQCGRRHRKPVRRTFGRRRHAADQLREV